MVLKGFDAGDVTESISEFKNSGLLHSQATKALKGLSKHQAAEQIALVEHQEREANDAAVKQDEYWKGVQASIQSNSDFRGIPISEKEKTELYAYVSQPGKDGLSQFQHAMQEAPNEVFLAIASLLKRDFNLDGIVARKASSSNAASLRERLSKNKERTTSSVKKKSGHVDNPDFASLDLDIK